MVKLLETEGSKWLTIKCQTTTFNSCKKESSTLTFAFAFLKGQCQFFFQNVNKLCYSNLFPTTLRIISDIDLISVIRDADISQKLIAMLQVISRDTVRRKKNNIKAWKTGKHAYVCAMYIAKKESSAKLAMLKMTLHLSKCREYS